MRLVRAPQIPPPRDLIPRLDEPLRHRRRELGDHLRVRRIADHIAHLVGVVPQVVQLIRVVHPPHVLPLLRPDHHRLAVHLRLRELQVRPRPVDVPPRARRLVRVDLRLQRAALAEHVLPVLLRLAPQQRQQRPPEVRVPQFDVTGFRQRRQQIDQLDQRLRRPRQRITPRRAHRERHVHEAVLERVLHLLRQRVVAHEVAVIRRAHSHRAVAPAALLQRIQHPAQVPVRLRAHAVVHRDDLTQFIVGDLVHPHPLVHQRQDLRLAREALRRPDRERDFGAIVHREVRLVNGVRRMRERLVDEHEERLRGRLSDELRRLLGHVVIRQRRPEVLRHFPPQERVIQPLPRLPRLHLRRGPPARPLHAIVARVGDHVHVDHVVLAAPPDVVSRLLEVPQHVRLVPPQHVVHRAVPVHVTVPAAGHRRPARRAHRVLHEAPPKAPARGREPIRLGRVDHRVAPVPGVLGAPLIGDKQHDVGVILNAHLDCSFPPVGVRPNVSRIASTYDSPHCVLGST